MRGRATPQQSDARLREIYFGAWEGLTWAEIAEREPGVSLPSPYAPDGGETFDELCARVSAAVEALDSRAHNGDRVLLTTHAGPLHALLYVLFSEKISVRFVPAGVTRLRLGPQGNRLIDLNRSVPHVVDTRAADAGR